MAPVDQATPKLPIEYPLGEAVSIYMRRLGVFAAVVIGELVLIALLLVVAGVQILPATVTNAEPTSQSEALAVPLFANVLFIDEFDTGISERWIVLEGEPLTTNGSLTSAAGLLVMQLAADPPPEYSVEFAIGDRSSAGAFIAWHTNMSLRYSVTYTEQGGIAAWQSLGADFWTDIEPAANVETGAAIEIFASKDLFVAMSNAIPSSVFPIVETFQPSPFVLSLSEGIYIDRVRLVIP